MPQINITKDIIKAKFTDAGVEAEVLLYSSERDGRSIQTVNYYVVIIPQDKVTQTLMSSIISFSSSDKLQVTLVKGELNISNDGIESFIIKFKEESGCTI